MLWPRRSCLGLHGKRLNRLAAEEVCFNHLIHTLWRHTHVFYRNRMHTSNRHNRFQVATPGTANTPKGNIYGYQLSPVDGIVPRTLAIQEEQYMPGLDFVGGYGRRAHGFSCSIINGYDTACDSLKKIGR